MDNTSCAVSLHTYIRTSKTGIYNYQTILEMSACRASSLILKQHQLQVTCVDQRSCFEEKCLARPHSPPRPTPPKPQPPTHSSSIFPHAPPSSISVTIPPSSSPSILPPTPSFSYCAQVALCKFLICRPANTIYPLMFNSFLQ